MLQFGTFLTYRCTLWDPDPFLPSREIESLCEREQGVRAESDVLVWLPLRSARVHPGQGARETCGGDHLGSPPLAGILVACVLWEDCLGNQDARA